MRSSRLPAGAASAALLALLAGCGGGTRQDAGEKSASYKVQIVSAAFPAAQQLAQASEMKIAVRNADTQTIPDVGVTVDSFTRQAVGSGDADPTRPIWIVESGPNGGTTAYNGTWALGALPPGETKTFTWQVTAVDPGRFDVHYRVNAGLTGKAVAKLADGSDPLGDFKVNVSGQPSVSRVDPATGRVIRTPAPPSASPNGASTTSTTSTTPDSAIRTTGTATTPPPPGH